jgi:hypothetical protein
MKLEKHFSSLSLSLVLLFVGGAIVSNAWTSMAQGTVAPASATTVVKASGYVSLSGIPRGREFQGAVVIDIASGYHMNSHEPSETYLIATTLTPQIPSGIELVRLDYPNGHDEKFTFSPDKPLNVYTGSVTLRLRLKAAVDAPLGATSIPMTLRYQACNDRMCLPPVKVPVNLPLEITPAGTSGHTVHPEIFSEQTAK